MLKESIYVKPAITSSLLYGKQVFTSGVLYM